MEPVIYDEGQIVTRIEMTATKGVRIEQYRPTAGVTETIYLQEHEVRRMLFDISVMLNQK